MCSAGSTQHGNVDRESTCNMHPKYSTLAVMWTGNVDPSTLHIMQLDLEFEQHLTVPLTIDSAQTWDTPMAAESTKKSPRSMGSLCALEIELVLSVPSAPAAVHKIKRDLHRTH